MSAIRQQWLSAGTGGTGYLGNDQRRVVLHWLGWRRHIPATDPTDLEPICHEWWYPPWLGIGVPRKPINMKSACVEADIATAGQGFTIGPTPYGARATGGIYGDRRHYQIVVRNGFGAVVERTIETTGCEGTPASALVAYIGRVRANYRRPESRA